MIKKKYSARKPLGGERVYSAYSSRLQFVAVGKPRQELEAVSAIYSQQQMKSKCMHAYCVRAYCVCACMTIVHGTCAQLSIFV